MQRVFQSELTYQESLTQRGLCLASGSLLLVTAAWLWHPVGLLPTKLPAGVALLISIPTVLVAFWMILQVRLKLVLGARSVSLYGAASVSHLDYVDLAAITYIRGVVREKGGGPGHRLTFVPKDAVREPLSTFIYDRRPLDPLMMRRLHELVALTES